MRLASVTCANVLDVDQVSAAPAGGAPRVKKKAQGKQDLTES